MSDNTNVVNTLLSKKRFLKTIAEVAIVTEATTNVAIKEGPRTKGRIEKDHFYSRVGYRV